MCIIEIFVQVFYVFSPTYRKLGRECECIWVDLYAQCPTSCLFSSPNIEFSKGMVNVYGTLYNILYILCIYWNKYVSVRVLKQNVIEKFLPKHPVSLGVFSNDSRVSGKIKSNTRSYGPRIIRDDAANIINKTKVKSDLRNYTHRHVYSRYSRYRCIIIYYISCLPVGIYIIYQFTYGSFYLVNLVKLFK